MLHMNHIIHTQQTEIILMKQKETQQTIARIKFCSADVRVNCKYLFIPIECWVQQAILSLIVSFYTLYILFSLLLLYTWNRNEIEME